MRSGNRLTDQSFREGLCGWNPSVSRLIRPGAAHLHERGFECSALACSLTVYLTISSLVHENPDAADGMIDSLSQLLRATLDISLEDEIPLNQELEFLDRYLEIQQTRFGDRLQIHREVDSEVRAALIPPLILQPLVENAVRYGIEPRRVGGTVTIRASRVGAVLRLEISDDGKGFSWTQLLQLGNGVGLSNTKARLQELYGPRHQFKQTLNHPTGACVKIEIPFRLSGKQNET